MNFSLTQILLKKQEEHSEGMVWAHEVELCGRGTYFTLQIYCSLFDFGEMVFENLFVFSFTLKVWYEPMK